MSIIKLGQKEIDKEKYNSIINKEFTELLNEEIIEEDPITVEEFFQNYDEIFYEIPIEGEINSHKELIKRSQEYVGSNQNSEEVELLLQEINQLNLTILEQQQIIDDLTQ